MKRTFIQKVIALLFVYVCTFQLSFAQTTTSWLTGLIKDTNGETLPGASVIAIHEPTGTKYGVSSRTDGGYDIPNMKIGGPYTIDIALWDTNLKK